MTECDASEYRVLTCHCGGKEVYIAGLAFELLAHGISSRIAVPLGLTASPATNSRNCGSWITRLIPIHPPKFAGRRASRPTSTAFVGFFLPGSGENLLAPTRTQACGLDISMILRDDLSRVQAAAPHAVMSPLVAEGRWRSLAQRDARVGVIFNVGLASRQCA